MVSIVMDSKAYHEEKEHISKSGLDKLRKSPAHFFNRVEEPDSSIFLIGRATHHYILEKDTFEDHFVVGPNARTNSNVWKDCVANNPDKDVLKASDFELIYDMDKAVHAHPEVQNLMHTGGIFEEAVFTELNGVKVKCKPDWRSNPFFSPQIGKETSILVDLKTTKDAEPGYFSRSIFNSYYRYYVQAAFYLDVCRAAGLDVSFFYFIAVEKTPPHPVSVFVMTMDAIDAGRVEYEQDLETYKLWRDEDVKPGYNNDQIVTVYPPHWLITNQNKNTTWDI